MRTHWRQWFACAQTGKVLPGIAEQEIFIRRLFHRSEEQVDYRLDSLIANNLIARLFVEQVLVVTRE